MNQYEFFLKVKELEQKYPNNFEFGTQVRNLINKEIKNFDIEIKDNEKDIIL
jgi:hypothetical protein